MNDSVKFEDYYEKLNITPKETMTSFLKKNKSAMENLNSNGILPIHDITIKSVDEIEIKDIQDLVMMDFTE